MGISVEVVDATNGQPAGGVGVTLWRELDAQWHKQVDAHTGDKQRTTHLGAVGGRGRYRLRLDLDPYFAGLGVTPFQSQVEVVFRLLHPRERVCVLLMVAPASCGAYLVLSGDPADATGQTD